MIQKNNPRLQALLTDYEAFTSLGEPILLDEDDFVLLVTHFHDVVEDERALDVVQLGLEFHPSSLDLMLLKSALLTDYGLAAEALECLDQASLYNPNDPNILVARAEAYLKLSDIDQVQLLLAELRSVANDTELQSDVFFLEAQLHEHYDAYDEMFEALQRTLQLNPKYLPALEYLWVCIENNCRIEECTNLIKWVIEQDPYNYLAWYYLGHAHTYRGVFEEAIEAYDYAFTIQEDFEPAYRDCAEICMETGQVKKALQCYLDIISLFSADGDLLLQAGKCYQMLDNPTLALDYFQQSLQLDSENDEAYFQLGVCMASQDRWTAALLAYEKALTMDENNEEYYLSVAIACSQLGKLERARWAYRHALHLVPFHMEYWQMFCLHCLESGEYDLFLNFLAEDEVVVEEFSELLYLKAAVLWKKGYIKSSYQCLSDALHQSFEDHSLLELVMPDMYLDPSVIRLIMSYQIP